MGTGKRTYLKGVEGGLPDEFCDRFWAGARLEPRCRSEEKVQEGLETRIADPLWMLGRQWQVGEFKAEDNGSPVRVHIEYETKHVNSVFGSPGLRSASDATDVRTPMPFSQNPMNTSNPPLETVVEREPILLDWRTRVQIGQQFERFVRQALDQDGDQTKANQILATFRSPPFGIYPKNSETFDYETKRFLNLMAGRAVDGKAVLDAYATGKLPALPDDLAVAPETLTKAFDALVNWYAQLYSQPDSDEQSDRKPRVETVVERQRVLLDWRMRVQIGRLFEWFLRQALHQDGDQTTANRVLTIYRRPAPEFFGIARPKRNELLDYATRRFRNRWAGRAMDGKAVLDALAAGRIPALPADIEIAPERPTRAFDALIEWYTQFYNQRDRDGQSYWKPRVETVVERELMLLDWHMRVQIGRQFEWFLRHALAQDKANQVLAAYRRSPPEYFGITHPQYPGSRRSIDGKAVLDAYVAGRIPALPAGVAVAPETFTKAFDAFVDWYKQLYCQPNRVRQSYWKPREFEYQFQLTAAKDDAMHPEYSFLVAPDYRNGDLDWYSCDVANHVPNEPWGRTSSVTVDPMRINFAGKPNERWWTFEDSNVDLAKVDPADANVARLLLLEFALVYADDWYSLPLEFPLGSLTRIRTLTVENVFGESVTIGPAIKQGERGKADWQLFTLNTISPQVADNNFLFLPPTLGDREESRPIEEVRFIRDEGANLVFAIEKTVQNGLGTPVDGFEAQMEGQERTRNGESRETVAKGDKPVYRLASEVPRNWIPYVPKRVLKSLQSLYGAGEASVRLRRAVMIGSEDSNRAEDSDSMTRILKDDQMHWLNEESVPRAGVKVQLTRQRVRWTDGKTYVWIGRKVVTGRGEGSSGLRFDFLESAQD